MKQKENRILRIISSKLEEYLNARLPQPEFDIGRAGNDYLSGLLGGGSFLVGRIGTTENNNLSYYRNFNRLWKFPFPYGVCEGGWISAGLFPPNSTTYSKWCELCEEALSLTDVYCAWHLSMEGYYKKHHLSKARFFSISTLEAYTFENPWTQKLEGKKVLVVHPFATTIENQYARHREKIFENPKMLPEFELKTVRAYQTLGGNTAGFASWFEAFDDTAARIDAQDFDVALVGAGSYGMPLCAHIRKMGKSAIYVGGCLQVFFGIKGRRWDETGLYNDYWVRPDEADKPANYQKIEGGCYW